MSNSSLASEQHFFHPHGKRCQTFKVLQYCFVVFILSENQENINFFSKERSMLPCQTPQLQYDIILTHSVCSPKTSVEIPW